MISYTCPRCKSAMTSPDAMSGKHDKCPKCGTLTVVPRYRPPVAEPQQARRSGRFKPVMNIADARSNPPRKLGLTGIVIGSIACVTLWYPIPYVPAALLGGIALACAALSHVASRRSWKKNTALPFLGSVLGLVAIYFSIFYGAATPSGRPDPDQGTSGAQAPVNPTGVLPVGMARQWNNRSLKVLAARIDTVALTSVDGERRSQAKFLIITIEASNIATRPDRYQQLTYTTLRGNPASETRTFASLSDAGNRFYRRVNFGANVCPKGGVSGSTPLAPGKSVRDILVFERPAGSAGPYRLELPLGNLGGTGTAVWAIPQSVLR